MKKENIVKTIAASLGFLLIYIAASNLAAWSSRLFYYLAYGELRVADYEAYTQLVQTLRQVNITYTALLMDVLFVIIITVIFRMRGERLLTRVRWNPVPKQTYAFVAILAVSWICAINLLMEFIMPQSWFQAASDYAATVTSASLVVSIIFAVVIAPLTEEFLYRGLMTTRLMGRLPLWGVFAFSSIIFGITHYSGGMGQIVGSAIVGLIYTMVYVWTNSLRAAALAHILNNSIGAFLPASAIAAINTPIRLIVGIALVAVAVFMMHLIYKRWNKEMLISQTAYEIKSLSQ